MFHEGDLQSGISLAVQQNKAVLCFVYDETETSNEWQQILTEKDLEHEITREAVSLRLGGGSQEAGFLSGICPINSTPAVVVIKNARLQGNLQSAHVKVEDLKDRLMSIFRNDGDPSTAISQSSKSLEYIQLEESGGRMRLPNNAYDALRAYTQSLLLKKVSPSQVLQSQIDSLAHLSGVKEEIEKLRNETGRNQPVLSEDLRDRLLRTPAADLNIPDQTSSSRNTAPNNFTESASTVENESVSMSTPNQPTQKRVSTSNTSSARADSRPSNKSSAVEQPENPKAQSQRANYIKMQKEREQKQREERERIKAQIKTDREERRRIEEMRKHGVSEPSNDNTTTHPSSSPYLQSTEVRLQVRTFEGNSLRKTFPSSGNLSNDVRPWIDSSSKSTIPYNLKLILTPLPNRNIEAGEEELPLHDLGISRSCTLVMVPVKGYVESYTGSAPGSLVGSAVAGGYNLVAGTAGALFGGVKSILGYGQMQGQSQQTTRSNTNSSGDDAQGEQSQPSTVSQGKARIRTLADQRAEGQRHDQQFYNGNQLNFEPNKDDELK